jgi:hypothetical protein
MTTVGTVLLHHRGFYMISGIQWVPALMNISSLLPKLQAGVKFNKKL